MTDPDAPDPRENEAEGIDPGQGGDAVDPHEIPEESPESHDPRVLDAADDDASAPSSRVRRTVYVGAAAVVLVTVGLIGWTLATGAGDEPTPGTSTAAAVDCSPVDAEVVALDGQAVQPDTPFCVVVTERSELTVGAAALEEGESLALSLQTVDGVELAAADTTLGTDPMVTVIVAPGAYVGYVTSLDGSEPPPFLVYGSALAAAEDLEDTEATEGPTIDECGDTIPLVTDEGSIDTDGSNPYLCLEITEDTFVVAGVESLEEELPDEGGADLLMSISWFDADGVARALRSNDDVFAYDPELTIDLEPGTYLVSASAWFGEDTGEIRMYAGEAGSVMRTGEVSSVIADVTEADCDAAPQVAVGDELTLDGEVEYLCLENGSEQRLRLEAATLGDQDLVLEVVTFEDGEPVRVAWSDDAPDSTSLADTDPAIDRVFPSGRLLIAVTTYFGGVASDYDLRVVAVD